MKTQKKDHIWLAVSIISFLLLSISFLLMPIESKSTTESISVISLISGVLFWLSIICGIVTQVALSNRSKVWLASNKIRRNNIKRRLGIVSFFQNRFAVVADITMIIGLVGLIISVLMTNGIGYACYIFLALFVFSFSMHCILNGKTFYVITNKGKIQQVFQKENNRDKREETSK